MIPPKDIIQSARMAIFSIPDEKAAVTSYTRTEKEKTANFYICYGANKAG